MYSRKNTTRPIRANTSREGDITRFFHPKIRSPRNQIIFQTQCSAYLYPDILQKLQVKINVIKMYRKSIKFFIKYINLSDNNFMTYFILIAMHSSNRSDVKNI